MMKMTMKYTILSILQQFGKRKKQAASNFSVPLFGFGEPKNLLHAFYK